MNDSPYDDAKPYEHEYMGMSDVKKMQVQGLTDIGKSFCDACDWIGKSHEIALAKTRMREAIFWAVEHIQKT